MAKYLKTSILFLAVGVLAGCHAQHAGVRAQDPITPTAGVAAVESLPLERGFFVRQGTPCGEASNATLTLHTGSGINAAQASCGFTRIEKTGDNTYTATEECYFIRAGESFSDTLHITVESRTAYSQATAGDESTWRARHCAQSSLPEPWRNNDLSEYLE